MKIEGDNVIFTTGRVEYANLGIIGLDDRMYVSYGYDGGFQVWPDFAGEGGLTREERRELADYMIALWTKFRDADGPIDDKD